MKKNLCIVASAFVALTAAFTSCNTTPSTNVSLVTDMDSISYSLGASVGENISGALHQMNFMADTASIAGSYQRQIEAEQDETKKVALKKEMRHKIDSTHKANEYAIAEFLSGFQAAVNSRESQATYNFGYMVGSQVGMQGGMMTKQFFGEDTDKKINKEAVIAAATAGLLEKPLVMPNASVFLQMKGQEMQMKQMQKQQEDAKALAQAGEDFLAINKTKEGVVTLPSGLQYKVLTEGTGDKPKLEDQVRCHYHGTLIDGTVFDSSINRGEPADFPVGGVIPGWIEALQLMPVGSKWELYIPSDLAYGEQGAGGKIGPNSALIFQIELLEILK